MKQKLTIVVLVLVACIVSIHRQPVVVAAGDVTVRGTLSILWSDYQDGTYSREFYVVADDGSATRIMPLEDQNIESTWTALGRRRVLAKGPMLTNERGTASVRSMQARDLHLDTTGKMVKSVEQAQSLPYVTILCDFPDMVSRPHPVTYYERLMSGVEPGMDHFWRSVSSNRIALGINPVVDWVMLPQPSTAYVDAAQNLNPDSVTRDCTAAAAPQVDFSAFSGATFVLNLDARQAYGGNWAGYAFTVLPIWGHEPDVAAHEMGHSFGLHWHTQSSVDFMVPMRNCQFADAVWGCLPSETIAFNKRALGWIAEERIQIIPWGTVAEIDLRALSAPDQTGVVMANIYDPDGSGRYFSLEARRPYGYDRFLHRQSVVVNEIDVRRSGLPATEVATLATGASWSSDGISVCTVAATANGYLVRIGTGTPVTCATQIPEFATGSRIEALVPWARTEETVCFESL